MIISTQAPRTPRPLRSAPLCLADHLERGPWTSAAAAVPSAEQQQQPPRTIRSGRKTREAPAIGCWNVLEGVIASRQHPRRASEPVSRVVDPPSSSRRRHHPPVESKTSLPLPKNPTVSSQASRRPGARHPCFFSHARSLAHVTWASATLRGSLVLHPVTPQHRPRSATGSLRVRPVAGAGSCNCRSPPSGSIVPALLSRAGGVSRPGQHPAPCELGQEAFSAAAHFTGAAPAAWFCLRACCCVLRAACCVLCLKTLNDSSTRLLFFPLPTPPRVLTRQPLFFLHTRPLCCQAATPS